MTPNWNKVLLAEGSSIRDALSVLDREALRIAIIVDDGKHILTNATGTTTPTNTKEIFKVTVGRNSTDTANIFYINGVANPRLSLARGNTYRFDTSDSSLYNVLTTANHQLKFSEINKIERLK